MATAKSSSPPATLPRSREEDDKPLAHAQFETMRGAADGPGGQHQDLTKAEAEPGKKTVKDQRIIRLQDLAQTKKQQYLSKKMFSKPTRLRSGELQPPDLVEKKDPVLSLPSREDNLESDDSLDRADPLDFQKASEASISQKLVEQKALEEEAYNEKLRSELKVFRESILMKRDVSPKQPLSSMKPPLVDASAYQSESAALRTRNMIPQGSEQTKSSGRIRIYRADRRKREEIPVNLELEEAFAIHDETQPQTNPQAQPKPKMKTIMKITKTKGPFLKSEMRSREKQVNFKIHEMRKQQQNEEAKEMQTRPKLNAKSKEILRQFGTRSASTGAKSLPAFEEIRIPASNQKVDRRLQRLQRNLKKNDPNLQFRKEVQLEQAQGCSFVPKINKKSRQIVEMNRSREERAVLKTNTSLGPSERSGILEYSMTEGDRLNQNRFSIKQFGHQSLNIIQTSAKSTPKSESIRIEEEIQPRTEPTKKSLPSRMEKTLSANQLKHYYASGKRPRRKASAFEKSPGPRTNERASSKASAKGGKASQAPKMKPPPLAKQTNEVFKNYFKPVVQSKIKIVKVTAQGTKTKKVETPSKAVSLAASVGVKSSFGDSHLKTSSLRASTSQGRERPIRQTAPASKTSSQVRAAASPAPAQSRGQQQSWTPGSIPSSAVSFGKINSTIIKGRTEMRNRLNEYIIMKYSTGASGNPESKMESQQLEDEEEDNIIDEQIRLSEMTTPNEEVQLVKPTPEDSALPEQRALDLNESSKDAPPEEEKQQPKLIEQEVWNPVSSSHQNSPRQSSPPLSSTSQKKPEASNLRESEVEVMNQEHISIVNQQYMKHEQSPKPEENLPQRHPFEENSSPRLQQNSVNGPKGMAGNSHQRISAFKQFTSGYLLQSVKSDQSSTYNIRKEESKSALPTQQLQQRGTILRVSNQDISTENPTLTGSLNVPNELSELEQDIQQQQLKDEPSPSPSPLPQYAKHYSNQSPYPNGNDPREQTDITEHEEEPLEQPPIASPFKMVPNANDINMKQGFGARF